MAARKNPNTLKVLLYKHFNRLVGPINLSVKAQVKKRIALEDETIVLLKKKMADAWHAAINEDDDTSFEGWFNKTQCKDGKDS